MKVLYKLYFTGKLPFFHTFESSVAEHLKLKANTITIIMPEIYHSKFEDKVYRYTKVGSCGWLRFVLV